MKVKFVGIFSLSFKQFWLSLKGNLHRPQEVNHIVATGRWQCLLLSVHCSLMIGKNPIEAKGKSDVTLYTGKSFSLYFRFLQPIYVNYLLQVNYLQHLYVNYLLQVNYLQRLKQLKAQAKRFPGIRSNIGFSFSLYRIPTYNHTTVNLLKFRNPSFSGIWKKATKIFCLFFPFFFHDIHKLLFPFDQKQIIFFFELIC